MRNFSKYCIYLFFLNCFTYSFSKAQIPAQILSKNSDKPIPYATIYFKKSGIGIHSDQEGKFEISQAIFKDSIIIRALGYKTVVSQYEKNVTEPIFYLDEDPILLPPLTIKKAVKAKLVEKGATVDRSNIIFGQMGGAVLREVALFVPNDEFKEGYLEKVSFYVSRFGKYKTPFRVHFYKSENSMPGKELILQPLIFQAKHANKYSSYDISEFDIPFDRNGIFISMEWLNLNDKKYFYKVSYPKTKTKREFYGQQIGVTKEFEEDFGRVRVGNSEWKNMNKFAAPMIRAKIKIYD